MSTFYEITAYPEQPIEVESEAAQQEIVRDYIERGFNHVRVVKWHRDDFDGRCRSLSMTVYEDGAVRTPNIHGY